MASIETGKSGHLLMSITCLLPSFSSSFALPGQSLPFPAITDTRMNSMPLPQKDLCRLLDFKGACSDDCLLGNREFISFFRCPDAVAASVDSPASGPVQPQLSLAPTRLSVHQPSPLSGWLLPQRRVPQPCRPWPLQCPL